jgi:hypothetical protein
MQGKGATKQWGVDGIIVMELKKEEWEGRYVGEGDGF